MNIESDPYILNWWKRKLSERYFNEEVLTRIRDLFSEHIIGPILFTPPIKRQKLKEDLRGFYKKLEEEDIISPEENYAGTLANYWICPDDFNKLTTFRGQPNRKTLQEKICCFGDFLDDYCSLGHYSPSDEISDFDFEDLYRIDLTRRIEIEPSEEQLEGYNKHHLLKFSLKEVCHNGIHCGIIDLSKVPEPGFYWSKGSGYTYEKGIRKQLIPIRVYIASKYLKKENTPRRATPFEPPFHPYIEYSKQVDFLYFRLADFSSVDLHHLKLKE